MAGVLWGLGLALAGVGAVLCWGARVAGVEDLYYHGGRLLLLALLCAGLALAWACEAWLWALILLVPARIFL